MSFLFFVYDLGITDVAVFGIILILFIPILVWGLKIYLTSRKIINLTDTKEGKRARIKFVLTEAATISSVWGIIDLIIYTVRTLRGLELYETIPQKILFNIMMFIIIIVVRVLTLWDEVREYKNQKRDVKN